MYLSRHIRPYIENKTRELSKVMRDMTKEDYWCLVRMVIFVVSKNNEGLKLSPYVKKSLMKW